MIYDQFHRLFDKSILIFLAFRHPDLSFCPSWASDHSALKKEALTWSLASHVWFETRWDRRSYQWITSPKEKWFSDRNMMTHIHPIWLKHIFGRCFFLRFLIVGLYISQKTDIHLIPTRRLVQIRCSKIIWYVHLGLSKHQNSALYRFSAMDYGCQIGLMQQKYLWKHDCNKLLVLVWYINI